MKTRDMFKDYLEDEPGWNIPKCECGGESLCDTDQKVWTCTVCRKPLRKMSTEEAVHRDQEGLEAFNEWFRDVDAVGRA